LIRILCEALDTTSSVISLEISDLCRRVCDTESFLKNFKSTNVK